MRFAVLGPLEVSAEGGPLALGGRKQRLLLAELLLAQVSSGRAPALQLAESGA
jgi:DNA-binding SARP family transcriptional activator